MTIHSLKWKEDSIFDFKIWGIYSIFEIDFQFVFFLNNKYNCKFYRINDHVITNNKEIFHFSVYHSSKDQQEMDLISNYSHPKYEKGTLFDKEYYRVPLIREYKEFNYFIKLAADLDEKFINDLIDQRKKDKIIKKIEKITNNNYKILENLILLGDK